MHATPALHVHTDIERWGVDQEDRITHFLARSGPTHAGQRGRATNSAAGRRAPTSDKVKQPGACRPTDATPNRAVPWPQLLGADHDAFRAAAESLSKWS